MTKKDYITVSTGVSGNLDANNDKVNDQWRQLEYGMFIHWGLYSVFGGERNGIAVKKGYSEQIQMWDDIPEPEYLEAAKQFTGENFNPKKICELAKAAGMKYIVITSKHHDGFAMFDTATTDYNVVKQTAFGKDPLKLLADECRNHDLKFGVYFSLVDWHQGHEFDENNCNPIPASMEPVIVQQLEELMTNYGEIAEVWFDMSSPTREQSIKFANIVRKHQPNAAINSRIWNNVGDFRTLNDNQVPEQTLDGPWQTPASIYHETWGYRRWQERNDFSKRVRALIAGLTSVHARGGNYLLNIGPRGDGSVVEFEEEVLRAIGAWLNSHPHAVIGAKATIFGEQKWGEVTLNNNNLFLHIINIPTDGTITLSGLATDVVKVVEDATSRSLEWKMDHNTLTVTMPGDLEEECVHVIRVELAGPLSVIPKNTITLNAGTTTTLVPDHFSFGRGFADRGSYFTLYQTTTRLTAFIAGDETKDIHLQIKGKIQDDAVNYQIQIGETSKIVTAGQLLESKIGPFPIKKNAITTLTIRLAVPNYQEEDLKLEFDSIVID
ncbi:alpha-L-fucosidase [Neobacillus kokaensis]|uniref:alpha-L-fucosidase n=1 Tax=Neobacillus kokaensis TaxID=2759023 RepID=A0ABQ3MZ15_9BACI|nr:alpha-L-fucosidase [Neobacillus kokaensis]GHH97919.1 hypothetical protein AM1BK_14620 [Neobacillus kokaensis]